MNKLQVNEIIQCKDKDDVINKMTRLAKAGVETEFEYFDDGTVGLRVISQISLKKSKVKKLLKMAEELQNYCREREVCLECPFAYGGYYCYMHGDNPTNWGVNDIFED